MKRSEQWERDCLDFRKEILKGKFKHWCMEWDGLPVDETCSEFICCACFDTGKFPEIPEIQKRLRIQFYKDIGEKQ